MPNYKKLLKYFGKVHYWKELAAFLLDDEDGSMTSEIEISGRYDVKDCLDRVIKKYLQLGDISWDKVISCLNQTGYKNIATQICKDLYVFTVNGKRRGVLII